MHPHLPVKEERLRPRPAHASQHTQIQKAARNTPRRFFSFLKIQNRQYDSNS